MAKTAKNGETESCNTTIPSQAIKSNPRLLLETPKVIRRNDIGREVEGMSQKEEHKKKHRTKKFRLRAYAKSKGVKYIRCNKELSLIKVSDKYKYLFDKTKDEAIAVMKGIEE